MFVRDMLGLQWLLLYEMSYLHHSDSRLPAKLLNGRTCLHKQIGHAFYIDRLHLPQQTVTASATSTIDRSFLLMMVVPSFS